MAVNPNIRRQRGIYSEVIDPENAQKIDPKLVQAGPKVEIYKSISVTTLPKAISLQRLQSRNGLRPNTSSQKLFSDERDILRSRMQSRNEQRKVLRENAKIVSSVNPKVMEPYDPIPGQVPRKVAIDRKKKQFASYQLEDLMLYLNVDFNQPDTQCEWLPLELFDDSTFDENSSFEWLDRTKGDEEESDFHPLTGRALFKNSEDNKFYYQKVEITSYTKETNKYKGRKLETFNADDVINFELHRIFVCFDAEDPRKYVLRLANAFQQRVYTDSIIRYNFYIDNMPTQDLSELDTEQKKRIADLAKTTKIEDLDTTALIADVNMDFSRTMNKIIFDTFLEECQDSEYFPKHLRLPPKEEEKEVRYYGTMELERTKGVKEMHVTSNREISFHEPKDFNDTFKSFCFASLYIKKEVIKALQEIRVECNKINDMDIFQLKIDEAMHLDQFKHLQESFTSSLIYQLRGTWIEGMVKIIKTQFADVGKGWFNMKENERITYDFGKLKKFLTVIRLMMQDTVTSLVQRNYNDYRDMILSFIPSKVIVHDTSNVENVFPEHVDEKKRTRALFQLDLKTQNDEIFIYSPKNPEVFVNVVLHVFDKALEELAKIPDLEPKIASNLYKGQNLETYIKTPQKPREKPVDPDPNARPRKFPDENKWIWEMAELLKERVGQATEPLADYLQAFDKYIPILKSTPEEYCKAMENEIENPRDIESINDEIAEVERKKKQLKIDIPEYIHVSCFQISCLEVIAHLEEKLSDLSKNLKTVIAKRAKEGTTNIFNQFTLIKAKLNEDPNNIEKLVELQEYITNMLPIELEKLKSDMNKVFDVYKIMEDFNYKFTPDEMNKRWNVFAGPRDILQLINEREGKLDKLKQKFAEEMKEQQDEFKQNYENLEQTIQGFSSYIDIKNHSDMAKMVLEIHESLLNIQDESRKFNQREHLFGKDMTEYNKLGNMQKEFTPYFNLWKIVDFWMKGFSKWMYDDFDKVNAEEVDKFVEEGVKTLGGIMRVMKEKELTQIYEIAQKVKAEMDEFKPKVPLLVALRKQGMEERHWKDISRVMGKTIEKKNEGFTFDQILQMDLMKHVDEIVQIGERAGKEFQIKTLLDTMETQWEEINFQLLPYKQTSIIRGYDDISIILDEHIVQTQSLLFSPYKKEFEERIFEWDKQLTTMSDVLEEWAKFQGQWMYLQPIFDSQDIAKQLPAETKKFRTIDSTWKTSVTQAKHILNVRKVCTEEGLYDKLRESNKNLEIIQKELNNYLEKKREKFARFYFLSNDELLEILSQTKEPTAVQPHLKKVFENIHKIEFDDQKKIHAMFSAENERVPFEKFVDPNRKNVEEWMGDVENMMKRSVRRALNNSVEDYNKKPRPKWCISHPGQCVLNGSQVLWTYEVEEAIKNEGQEDKVGIKGYWDKLKLQLDDLVDLVCTKLTKQQQVTINALIVIDVHAKDVVQRLINENVKDVSAFEWISQLRYYVENEDVRVKCVQTDFPYGYEYLGNTLRLVITPLTDKCYMTLMGALKLNLGGAPAGPAGTGKTESTKDLAKALAKQCVVFNCSDSMDYIMVGKFFKGLASAGAWCCFDEFNRINIEVLSVIAQQLLQLFGAKDKGIGQIEFEGSNIKVLPTFCVFITMNPGYAGRTELPDNLKALFRSVAMMVPDYAMIGEIMLYSFGFKLGRELAQKMVVTFKLSSEQLSSQDHYDYGMRAVRSVINAAGLLKSATPDMDEQQLLLRALRDVNVPKFLKDDIPLFENIISDLFPGVERPKYEYGDLVSQMSVVCKDPDLNLQPVQAFTDKVLQLYDTIQVRHGLMLVGPTGGGKTSNYLVLQRSLSNLHDKGFYKVHTHIMNPKSITMGQLYGQFNEQTHEWTDGILAYIIRETVKDTSSDKHWILFDGPVDAIWIESMNTVLDDNKKLCLNSGQILTLTPHMTMMFEVEDLAVASPATVSRCGMVYMEPISLGLQPLIDSWLNSIPPNIQKRSKIMDRLKLLFDKLLQPCLTFLRKQCKEIVVTGDNNLTQSLQRILNSYFAEYAETEFKRIPSEEIDNLQNMIDQLFIFSLIWSVMATCDSESRQKFSEFYRSLFMTVTDCGFPQEDSVYNYFWNKEKKVFENWQVQYASFEVSSKYQYHEIMIPTNDSTRNIYMKKLLVSQGYHVMCPGPTGTGKSQNCYSLLTTQLGEEYQYIALTFSAQTSANQTQDTIDSKMDKRRKGIFGPPIGKKCIIFVDDLNMPKKETYGAQPPIELLRQFLDHQGWYNRRDLVFMKFQDIILLAAMGPPGGGRSNITARCTRHFNILAYPELERTIINQLFQTLVKHFFKKFDTSIKEAVPQLVESVIEVYYKVKNELLPTPSKSHYTFNMRDISKVFQGMCSATTNTKTCSEVPVLIRLWYHENMRVFHDRLTTDQDRQYLKEILSDFFQKFNITKEEVLTTQRVIFTDFLQGRELEPRIYAPVDDLDQFIDKMDYFQEEYNTDNTFVINGPRSSMKLVMFLDACEHIARIARIIRQPQGNALLFGVGGSGRQSLARMATFLSNYKLFQIEVIKNYNMRSWRDDIKKCLMMAGVENKSLTFLFVDTQIINEQMLEDINNILNSGDVTNIYQEKDMEDIQNACKMDCIKKGLQPNKMNIFTQYLIRVKKNVHIVIAMSPIGEAFATRLRMFPSLVSCSTIDWFTEWPEEALLGVGKGQLVDFEEELRIQGLTSNLVTIFKDCHKSVEKISQRYFQELRRYNYVTPTSFLELLNLYKSILDQKNKGLNEQISRLKSGLDKLAGANKAVEEMKITLTKMRPELEIAQEQTQKMMEYLEVEQKDADETQKIVAKEEIEAKKQEREALELAEKAEAAVAEANNSLAKTLKNVSELKKEHLVEVKSLQTPPEAVKITLAGVVILCTDHVKKVGEIIITAVKDSFGKKEENYFQTAKQYLLTDPKELLNILMTYNRENINPKYIEKLEKVCFPHPKFNEADAYGGSKATGYLFGWVKAMYDFHKVFTDTEPLRKQLDEVKRIVQLKTEELREKKESLEKINQKINNLRQQSEEKIRQKEYLTNQIKECEIKLERAQKLTDGLKDEKERWSRDIEVLSEKGKLYPGDAAIAAAMLAYSGSFVASYRSELEHLWIKYLKDLGILHTDNITMRQFLGDEVQIQTWNLCGLPKDGTSIENGILIDKSRRRPLMIDPQNQANKYIKNLGREVKGDIIVQKVNDPSLMRSIEQALQFGKWVLVEAVGRDLDPSLEPVLNQQLIRQGNEYLIQFGEKRLNYSPEFRFFMTTNLRNPHYSPETSVKVTIINFAITPFGLEEQMLARVVEKENPNLENRKNEIVRKNAQDKRDLVATEDQILSSLSSTKGDIADILLDETLINQLQNSKKFAAEINQRVKDSKKTEIEIDKAREGYRPVAFRTSILFFCILELATIDPMYQYSLQWFINLFEMGVENAEQSEELDQRLHNLNEYFTYSLYENVCRSLFEKHKLIFSFLLTQRILASKNEINLEEWQYLLSGPQGSIHVKQNPTNWIADSSWPDIYKQLYGMNKLPNFQGIEDHFMENPDSYKDMYDAQNPHEMELPGEWNTKLDEFEKIVFLKFIRSDKCIPAIQNWIKNKIGQEFIIVPTFDLAKCFKDSTILTPLIFVLSPGSDPVSDFQKFAEENNMTRKVKMISLGQGQGPKAEKLIVEGKQAGGWILLQNCHLATSWMPELERLCEEFDETMHKDFRLWLTSAPSSTFPSSVLQNGVKMTIEPPTGLRANLLRSYKNLSDQELSDCKKPNEFKKLLFGFCLFHAIIQDRRKFGPIGWNIAYEFTNEDLGVCKKQLKLLLDEYNEIPYKVLNYLGAEINYGGRVTDDKDIRLIKSILASYCCKDVLRDGHKFSESGLYLSIPASSQEDYIKYIENLPLNPAPEAFGLHDNAEITNAQNETRDLLESLLSLQPREQGGEGKSREEKITEIANFIQQQTPPVWDIESISKQYPTDYNESMNTVLVQELIRYNRLLEIMAISLVQVKKALVGLIVMSEELEILANNLHDNQVPHMWNDKGHLSLKPLMSWIEDLNQRVNFLNDWINNGTPKIFWIAGFFFPQAFITGTLQNYARRKFVAIDRLQFEYKVLDIDPSKVKEKPEEGCYVYGIYLEGARWDYKKQVINQPKPKELYSDLPVMHLLPVVDRQKSEKIIYNCPLYKVVSRRGTLSTTGHSTNFVMFIELPSNKSEDTWIRGGVAAFLALRY
ncbi:hypothetical protein ABPG74_009302 [Tetrahymena malaccensis]